MSTTNRVRRHFRLISLAVIIPLMLVLYGSAVLSSGLTSVGLLTFARYLRASSQTISTPILFQAEHLLRQAILWNPANASAHRGLGFALAAQGRDDEAIAAWQAAEGIAEEFIQRGEQARSAKNYEEALVWYERATMVEPRSGDPWYYAGLMHETLEQWEQGLKAYEQAVKAGGFELVGQSSPYYRLGRLHHRRLAPTQLDKALAAYDAAFALDSFSTDLEAADTHYGRGVIYDRQGRDPRDSIREYQQAVALDPEHKWAHLKLGYALYQEYEDISLAEQEIEQALALWRNNKSRKWPYRLLGDIYRDAGLIEKAMVAYQEALRLDASDKRVQKALSDLARLADE